MTTGHQVLEKPIPQVAHSDDRTPDGLFQFSSRVIAFSKYPLTLMKTNASVGDGSVVPDP